MSGPASSSIATTTTPTATVASPATVSRAAAPSHDPAVTDEPSSASVLTPANAKPTLENPTSSDAAPLVKDEPTPASVPTPVREKRRRSLFAAFQWNSSNNTVTATEPEASASTKDLPIPAPPPHKEDREFPSPAARKEEREVTAVAPREESDLLATAREDEHDVLAPAGHTDANALPSTQGDVSSAALAADSSDTHAIPVSTAVAAAGAAAVAAASASTLLAKREEDEAATAQPITAEQSALAEQGQDAERQPSDTFEEALERQASVPAASVPLASVTQETLPANVESTTNLANVASPSEVGTPEPRGRDSESGPRPLSTVVGGRAPRKQSRPRPMSEVFGKTFGRLRAKSRGRQDEGEEAGTPPADGRRRRSLFGGFGRDKRASVVDGGEPIETGPSTPSKAPQKEPWELDDDIPSSSVGNRNSAFLAGAAGATAVTAAHGPNHGADTSLVLDDDIATNAPASQLPPRPQRMESWNEPDATLPPRTPQNQTGDNAPGSLARLGVLPSPAVTTFAGTSPVTSRRGTVGHDDIPDQSVHADVEPRKRSVSSAVEQNAQERKPSPDATESAVSESKATTEEAPKPGHRRRTSDLYTLPSQRLRRESLSQKPASMNPLLARLQGVNIDNTDSHDGDIDRVASPSSINRTETPNWVVIGDGDSVRVASPSNINRTETPNWVALDDDDNMDDQAPAVPKAEPVADQPKQTIAPPELAHLATATNVITPTVPLHPPPEPPTERVASLAPSEISRPATREQWADARSEISAEDAADIAPDQLPGGGKTAALSRHSSVSSLGEPESERTASVPASRPTSIIRTATGAVQSVSRPPSQPGSRAPSRPPSRGPPTPRIAAPLPTSQQNSDAPVPRQLRPALAERPLSYMPLPRDASGRPIPETIHTGRSRRGSRASKAEEEAVVPPAVDLSDLSGPPVGAPPFQQHPVYRDPASNARQMEYAMLRSTGNFTSPAAEGETGDRSSRRMSGYFRGQTNTSDPNFIAPASAISDQHGLEDIHTTQGGDDGEVDQLSDAGKLPKQRTGIWSTISGRRTSNPATRRFSRENSAPAAGSTSTLATAATTPTEKGDRPNTLRKIQRTQSSSQAHFPSTEPMEQDTKAKKRFSGLGSIFGRSDTTGKQEGPKTNRLTKRDPSKRPQSTIEPLSSGTVPGNVDNYASFEAMRRDMSAWQGTSRLSHSRDNSNSPPKGSSQPPPDGWYGPSSNQQWSGQEGSPPPTAQPNPQGAPPFRRLHSGGQRMFDDIPEAFRPVGASYNGPVEPIGPPPERFPPTAAAGARTRNGPSPPRRTSDPRIDSQSQHPPMPPMPAHHMAYAGMNRPGQQRQKSYGSEGSTPPEYGRPGHRSHASLPRISPISSYESQPGQQPSPQHPSGRVGSIDSEMARSPARDYVDQQTPWALTLPDNYPRGNNRPPPRSTRPDEFHIAPRNGPPPRPDYRSENSGPRGPPQQYSSSPVSPYGYIRSPSPVVQLTYQQQQDAAYYGRAPPPPAVVPAHYAPPDPHALQMQRYAEEQQQQQQRIYGGRSPNEARYGDDSVYLRGASYPGQEWEPVPSPMEQQPYGRR